MTYLREPNAPTALHMGNLSAMAIPRNLKFHNRIERIEVQHRSLRQKVEGEALELACITIGGQVADAPGNV
jgi:hypothetical protein